MGEVLCLMPEEPSLGSRTRHGVEYDRNWFSNVTLTAAYVAEVRYTTVDIAYSALVSGIATRLLACDAKPRIALESQPLPVRTVCYPFTISTHRLAASHPIFYGLFPLFMVEFASAAVALSCFCDAALCRCVNDADNKLRDADVPLF